MDVDIRDISPCITNYNKTAHCGHIFESTSDIHSHYVVSLGIPVGGMTVNAHLYIKWSLKHAEVRHGQEGFVIASNVLNSIKILYYDLIYDIDFGANL